MVLIVIICHVAEVSLMGYDKNLLVHKDHQGDKKCSTKLWVEKDKHAFIEMTEEEKWEVFSVLKVLFYFGVMGSSVQSWCDMELYKCPAAQTGREILKPIRQAQSEWMARHPPLSPNTRISQSEQSTTEFDLVQLLQSSW